MKDPMVPSTFKKRRGEFARGPEG
ncbi:uncharacterized protein METZ01_LOCUS498133, partial [marine metagenome]